MTIKGQAKNEGKNTIKSQRGMEIQTKSSLIPDNVFILFFKMVNLLFIVNYLLPYIIMFNYYLYFYFVLNYFPDLANMPLFFKT